VSSSEFSLIVGHLKAIDGNLTIQVSDEAALFETKDEAVSGNVFLKRRNSVKGGGGGAQIDMTQDISMKFPLSYFVEFSNSATFSDTVQLKLGSDLPLLVCVSCTLYISTSSLMMHPQVSYKFVHEKVQYYLVRCDDYERY
jgi:hypothetical protein